jgi:hypothetical protein
MSLTFGNEQILLDKLSDADRGLAVRDAIAFGMYCIEEVDGAARRVDVRNVELRNGKIHRQTKVVGAFDPVLVMPSKENLAYAFRSEPRAVAIEDHMIRQSRSELDWKRVWKDAMRRPVDTSWLPIWKKYDPGAI